MKRLAIVLAGALILVGCSSGGGSGSGPSDSGGTPNVASTTTGQPTTADQAGLDDSTPTPEGSGPESPQAPSKQPSISVASLPIGGGPPDQVNGLQCQHVFLTNVSGQLPDGTQLAITGVRLDPDGVFSIVDDSCGGSDQSCQGYTWTTGSLDKSCLVAAKQNDAGSAQPGDTVALTLTGEVTCPDQATCDRLQPLLVGSDGGPGSLGGSQLAFTVPAGQSSDG